MKNFLRTCLKYYTDPLVIKIVLYQLFGLTIMFIAAMIWFAIIGNTQKPINYLISWAVLEGAFIASWIIAIPLGVFTYINLIEEKDDK